MKMRLCFSFAISLCLLLPITLYGAPVPAAVPMTSNALAAQIGIAAAVKGTVKISNKTQVGKIVSSGESIYLGDEVSTDADSNLQILLLDETIFTIGPNSGIVIDKFIYDPSTHDGEVKAKVVKGVFRFVTGKIGQKKPQQMEVDLPSGTIGIRGTIVVGQSIGGKSLVALLGPGARNNTRHKQGSFVLSNGNNQETVNKTGFGSTIDGNGAPSKPFQVPAEQLSKMTSALGTGGGDSSDSDSLQSSSGSGDSDSETEAESEDSPTESAGQDTAVAGEFAMEQGEMGSLINDLTSDSDKASQDSTEEDLFGIIDGFTTWEDLANAPNLSGIHHYTSGTFNLFDISNSSIINGDANFDILINFSTQQIGVAGSHVSGNMGSFSGVKTCTGCPADGTFQFNLTPQSFGSGDDIATFEYSSLAFTGGDGCSNNCEKADIEITLLNAGGEVAEVAVVEIEVKDAGGANINGEGVGVATIS